MSCRMRTAKVRKLDQAVEENHDSQSNCMSFGHQQTASLAPVMGMLFEEAS